MTDSRWKWTAILVIVVAYFALLGTRGLNEPDEGRYAEIAREMIESGDWLVSHLNGIEHFQKPPLIYWATAASMKIFGVNEWAARLPVALAALGMIGATVLLGRTLFGSRAGWLAGMIVATTGGVFLMGRLLTPDMLMAFWITVALACLARTHRGGGRAWAWGFFIAMGLGFMTKGPMSLVVPGSAALCLAIAERKQGRRLKLSWLRGWLLALAIGLSWFAAVTLRHPELKEYFLGYELVQRFASKSHGRSRPFWFFIPLLPVFFLPWSLWLVPLMRRAWQRWQAARSFTPAQAMLLGAVVIPFIVLSMSGSKLPTYVLPLMPPLAVALAAHWVSTPGSPRRPVFGLAGGALACWLSAVAVIEKFDDQMGAQASVRNLATIVEARPDFASAALFSCNLRAHGWEFYLERMVSVTKSEADVVLKPSSAQKAGLFRNTQELEEAMRARPVAYGLVRSDTFTKTFEPQGWKSLGRSGDFVLVTRPAA
jgi:4-amino-4-deoxy-L-arabinose transferase-like glycosyltransferase